MTIDLSYLIFALVILAGVVIYFTIRRDNEDGLKRSLQAKEAEVKYYAKIDEQTEDDNEKFKIINIRTKDKDIQRECQNVVVKMYANGYKLTAVAPIVESRRIDHSAGDYAVTDTVSIVHYFEKKSVVENTTETPR